VAAAREKLAHHHAHRGIIVEKQNDRHEANPKMTVRGSKCAFHLKPAKG
jgi:hypothetical protein